ncbi:hypothetical protein GCM10017653_40990 [Ancylobacter defluvii]|uniref:Uncharacterized protein n=1 Tax=Ancylobacter defluvii TaxID=1282440 RepID=A0A9W6K204_9HYPH|nr:hypothetical protein GCM10017653_40990 [Ancylobacter defluvii]
MRPHQAQSASGSDQPNHSAKHLFGAGGRLRHIAPVAAGREVEAVGGRLFWDEAHAGGPSQRPSGRTIRYATITVSLSSSTQRSCS